jgi:YD repeat-containing protein
LTYYKYHTGISHLISTTKKTYNGSNYVALATNFGYESPYHTLQTSDTTTDSQGNVLINKTYYSKDYANSATADNVFGKMNARNLLEPVRTDSWRNGNLVGEKVTKYYDFASSAPDTLIYPANVYNLEAATPLTPAQAGESTSWTAPVTTLIPNSYLISKVNFSFDPNTGRMINQQLTEDKSQGIQWSDQLKLPVALVDNAKNTPTLKEFYYEGFEESTTAGLYTGNAHTGTHGVFAPYTVNWTRPNSRNYVISYWYFSGSKWHFRPEQAFTDTLTLSGGTLYDDIRIHPADANMITYTYTATGDLTSTTDAKGLTTYYEYDSFQRLKNIRDKDKNIVKSFCYNYAGQANGCYVNAPTYWSHFTSRTLSKSCAGDYTGSPVTYSVADSAYSSNISQQDAEDQAAADLDANAQNYANANGTCTINIIVNLSNTTSDGYHIGFSGYGNPSQTYPFAHGSTQIHVPSGTYNIDIFPDVNNNNLHNFSLTGQADQTQTVRGDFSGVNVTAGSNITITIY